ncbi:hypothetical protein MRX98_12245 [Desulfatitalea sp. M08but]|uniref:Uncharacterized protein n=1 Tax=Desulfatitalea alkaliphila TaxID=2929485 RepID=A0AA41ULC3_9BACT|nr:hypothetical protein [Desulfatitalea alkaliphila]
MYTNDPRRREFNLTMSGRVDRFAEISPQRLVLAGYVGDTLQETVTIRPTRQHPFTITGVRLRDGQHLKFKMDRSSGQSAAEYRLHIENTKADAGRYVDQIFLETDSELHPEIRLAVSVFIRPAQSGGGS